MKFRLEIDPLCQEDEIHLRCRQKNDRILALEQLLSSFAASGEDMILRRDDTEYYIPKKDILFFETSGGSVVAHTATETYTTDHRLFELESIMPRSFLRVSKSCVLNAEAVRSLSHGLTGTGEVTFAHSDKVAYVSRAYYKYLKERIYDLRFSLVDRQKGES